MKDLMFTQLHADAVCFQMPPQQIIKSLSVSNTGSVVLKLAEPLPDRVLWFGLGLMISLELSRDIGAIQIVPDMRVSSAASHALHPAEIFGQLESICSYSKDFFLHTACAHWSSPVQECCIKKGFVQWQRKHVSIGFHELVDIALQKNQTAKCA
jgi:hypothetical protein